MEFAEILGFFEDEKLKLRYHVERSDGSECRERFNGCERRRNFKGNNLKNNQEGTAYRKS